MQPITRATVEAMDVRDPLAGCREWFTLPPGVIYLDGNSLGALPATTPGRLARVVEAWGRDLIGSWNRHDWIGWPRRVGDRIARLVGAQPARSSSPTPRRSTSSSSWPRRSISTGGAG